MDPRGTVSDRRSAPSWRVRRVERSRQRAYDKEFGRLVSAMGGRRTRSAGLRAWFGRVLRTVKRTALVLAVVLTVAAAGIWYVNPGIVAHIVDALDGEQFPAPNVAAGHPAEVGYPPSGIEAKKEPLGMPPVLPAPGSSYKFLHGSPPVAYDPCRPIHYVTRPDNAPPGGQQLIGAAVADAAAAAGLVFIDDGATNESYGADRWSYQPERYGKRWAPVLITWSTGTEQPRFRRNSTGLFDVAGLGGSQLISGDEGGKVFVSGTVQLNAESIVEVLTRENGEALTGAIIRHELGHVLGLDHVEDPSQLMNPSNERGITNFADGDLAGLAQLGQGKCFPNH